jgi:hypothetical protein
MTPDRPAVIASPDRLDDPAEADLVDASLRQMSSLA